MIKIENYSKSYDGKNFIVRDVNLHVEKGDLYGFIGHNGAGKTTTLKSVVGILKFEKGNIFINNNSIKANEIECKKIMAYIPDNPELYENLTGLQYINFINDLYEVDNGVRLELINEYCTKLDLVGVLNDLISSYSHGMKQKLVIIASLVHSPKVLVLDEPFVGLDPLASYNLKQIMEEFCSKGNSILFSTHVLEVAQKICNKIAIIKNGEIIIQGETKELTKDQSLEELFLEQANE